MIPLPKDIDEKFEQNKIEDSNDYVKLPDGTLIQWGEVSLKKIGADEGYTTSVSTAVQLPISFKDTQYKTFLTSQGGVLNARVMISVLVNTNAKMTVTGFYTLDRSGADELKYNWIAIGKWK